MSLSTLPDCVLLTVFELARSRTLLRRVSSWHRLYVDGRLLPSASAPLSLVVPLDPSMGGRFVWEAFLSRISRQLPRTQGLADPWAHRSLRLVAPPVAPVSPRDRRPARLAAWPTLINCLRAAVAVGVAKHIVSIDLAFAAPYVEVLDTDALRPLGVLTVSSEEVDRLFSRTSLRAFVLRAAACDRSAPCSTGSPRPWGVARSSPASSSSTPPLPSTAPAASTGITLSWVPCVWPRTCCAPPRSSATCASKASTPAPTSPVPSGRSSRRFSAPSGSVSWTRPSSPPTDSQ